MCKRKNDFCQNHVIFDNFEVKLIKNEVRLQCRASSLCHQLLLEFSSNQFETLHRCYKHIECVDVTFCRHQKFLSK